MEGCSERLTIEIFSQLLSDEQFFLFKYRILQNALTLSQSLLHCPGHNCRNILKLLRNSFVKTFKEKIINVLCSCGECFCSICSLSAHRPLSCQLYENWNSLVTGKYNNSNLDELWAQVNTKKCPKCHNNIEKN